MSTRFISLALIALCLVLACCGDDDGSAPARSTSGRMRGAINMAGPMAVSNVHALLLEGFLGANPDVITSFDGNGTQSDAVALNWGSVNVLLTNTAFTEEERAHFVDRHGVLPTMYPAFLGPDGSAFEFVVMVYMPGDLDAVVAALIEYTYSDEGAAALRRDGFSPLGKPEIKRGLRMVQAGVGR